MQLLNCILKQLFYLDYMKLIIKLLLLCLDKLEKINYCTIRNIIHLICKREYKSSYDKLKKYNKAYVFNCQNN